MTRLTNAIHNSTFLFISIVLAFSSVEAKTKAKDGKVNCWSKSDIWKKECGYRGIKIVGGVILLVICASELAFTHSHQADLLLQRYYLACFCGAV